MTEKSVQGLSLNQTLHLVGGLRKTAAILAKRGNGILATNTLKTAEMVLSMDSHPLADHHVSEAKFDVKMDLLALAESRVSTPGLYPTFLLRDCVDIAKQCLLPEEKVIAVVKKLHKAAQSPGRTDAADASNNAWAILRYQIWRRQRGDWGNVPADVQKVPASFRRWARKWEQLDKERGWAL
jgi:hypothetical protein